LESLRQRIGGGSGSFRMKAFNADASRSKTKMTMQPAKRIATENPALARMLATLERQAMHDHIVRKFRAFSRELGDGPSESDLRTFAHLAIAEQRMAGAHERSEDAVLDRACAGEPEITK
jgi:hypothetical protein